MKPVSRAFNFLANLAVAGLAVIPVAALADEERTEFVEANVIAILYHELAHAVIDLMDVPIFGQEEDAADAMAVLLIDQIFEEDSAQSIAYDSAFGYLNDPDGEFEISWWDVHGPDEQRYYNHVCLFYGAAPDERDDLAEDLGLPEERAESCPEEFELASDSWTPVFDDMAQNAPGTLDFADGSDEAFPGIVALLDAEIEELNAEFGLPETVDVRFEACGDANAFYDPADASITLCTEFIPFLEELYDALSA